MYLQKKNYKTYPVLKKKELKRIQLKEKQRSVKMHPVFLMSSSQARQ